MKVIGITGTTGSGKTTALQVLQKLGAAVYDCDEVYHELLHTDEHLLQLIENTFPGVVKEGILDRKALGGIVFNDPVALMTLNGITHGCVCEEVVRRIQNCGKPFAAVDAIALFESGFSEMCDYTVAITAPEDVRVRRLMEREGISEDYARLRISAQKDAEFFEQVCDFRIANDKSKPEFEAECEKLFRKLLAEKPRKTKEKKNGKTR